MTQLVELSLPQLDTFLPESFCSLLFSLACLRCRPGEPLLVCTFSGCIPAPLPRLPAGQPKLAASAVSCWQAAAGSRC